jgi:hypothetical protein
MYGGRAGEDDGDYELAPIDDAPTAANPQRAAAPDDGDDDAELELEPIDAEILAAAKRRAEETVSGATKAVDIDEIYRDIEPNREFRLPTDLFDNLRVQFGVKHLLIATAVVAVLLTFVHVFGYGGAPVVLFMLAVFAATAYVHLQERKRQAEADRKRQEMYAARRELFRQRNSQTKSDGGAEAARKLAPEDFYRARQTPPRTDGDRPLS